MAKKSAAGKSGSPRDGKSDGGEELQRPEWVLGRNPAMARVARSIERAAASEDCASSGAIAKPGQGVRHSHSRRRLTRVEAANHAAPSAPWPEWTATRKLARPSSMLIGKACRRLARTASS